MEKTDAKKTAMEYMMTVIAKAEKYDRIVAVLDNGGTIEQVREAVDNNG